MEIIYKGKFDYIGEPLRCATCGNEQRDPHKAGCQTKIAKEPKEAVLHKGDELLCKENPAEGGYFINKTPIKNTFTFLEEWHCETCGPLNWIKVTVSKNKIADVKVILLSKETLSETNFLPSTINQLVPLEFVDRNGGDMLKLFKERYPDIIKEILKTNSAILADRNMESR